MTEKAGKCVKMKTKIIVRIKLKFCINCRSCCTCGIKKGTQNDSPEKTTERDLIAFFIIVLLFGFLTQRNFCSVKQVLNVSKSYFRADKIDYLF
ncbi:hypothetical protein Lpar_1803 [Legionella parisiensis]|uniref:Uncharacterized protein n=1 Tax=Legionella parisiensis TaxID=45071 RepID=A0A1E5JWI5_9GAMM|nr:hypothetical protein Lpar_1803 [Legionella parisiensis]OEH48458.1 hypothetical protein lpari_00533 [Legionella parisiensis]STX77079.1 Uncharacterised protein [Legionella parisiensis]